MVLSTQFNNDLQALRFMNILSEEEKLALWTNTTISTCYDDQDNLIYSAGDPCKNVYFLLQGSVKIVTLNEGREHISIILHAGQIFGECCLFGSETMDFTAVGIESETKFVAIDSKVFKELMKSNFTFNMYVLESLGKKLRKKEERLYNFVMKDARQRIIEFLKDNAEVNSRKVGLETLIKHGLTQQDIANFTGTSRQTVTTVLNDLKNANKIHLRRKSILIRDMATLV
jgi:CRP/FNR family transcriptional regulator, cyclic AMP receptor protein